MSTITRQIFTFKKRTQLVEDNESKASKSKGVRVTGRYLMESKAYLRFGIGKTIALFTKRGLYFDHEKVAYGKRQSGSTFRTVCGVLLMNPQSTLSPRKKLWPMGEKAFEHASRELRCNYFDRLTVVSYFTNVLQV